jgi:hypothetical protein
MSGHDATGKNHLKIDFDKMRENISNAKLKDLKLDTFGEVDDNGNIENINAPKTIERLEEISEFRSQQRKMESQDDDDNKVKLSISEQTFDLDDMDVHNIEEPKLELLPDLLIDDIEILE